MVSKEASSKSVVLSNSESDSDGPAGPSHGLEGAAGRRQVKKRNKALQVRFKDICEAQNQQRAAAAAGKASRSISCKVTYRKYMTMPARRSIPNVTKSTGVQTSPDLTKRYQTFPFERKKGHTIKHTALVESYQGQNNGFLSDVKGGGGGGGGGGEEGGSLGASSSSRCSAKIVGQTKALLHHTDDSSGPEDLLAAANCVDGPTTRPEPWPAAAADPGPGATADTERRSCGGGGGGDRKKHRGLSKDDASGGDGSAARPKKTGPVAWNSLTHVDCIGSPSAGGGGGGGGGCKRKKATQPDGGARRSQTLPHSAGCSAQGRAASGRTPSAVGPRRGAEQSAGGPPLGRPQRGDGEIKAQLQAMETLISSSQETIKVLLGVIQELEKGEAQREGLTYRTGQDTANCDTCRNSACIIYSVELDFKQQEEKLQPLIKRLCPMDHPQCPALSYHQEVFTSTPKRKSKTESKKHGRWKLWFL